MAVSGAVSRARYLVLLIPLVGIGELVSHIFFASRAPDLNAWQDAVPLVRQVAQRGDLVVVAPRWAEPNARWALGDELMPIEDVARPDESAYGRAIELSILGESLPEVAGWPITETRSSGPFSVRVRTNPDPAKVRFDFVASLDPEYVEVYEERGRDRSPCPFTDRARSKTGGLGGPPTFPRRRFDCPSAPHTFAGVTVIDDERYLPRRCIWAHPIRAGRFVIRFRNVPLAGVIRGYGGIPWLKERERRDAPVELEVRVGGRSIGVYVHHDGDGWKPFSFSTGAAGRTEDVEFETRAADVGARWFCFQADSR